MIKRVQVYTVARNPTLAIVSSLSNAEVDAIAARVRTEAHLPAEAFYGDVPEGRERVFVLRELRIVRQPRPPA